MAAVSGALVFGAMPVVASAEDEPEAGDRIDCADTAPTAEEASALAIACDQDVEVLGERTEWETVYATPRGTMRSQTSMGAVRTQVSSEWADIDTAVIEAEDGLVVASPLTPMVFSDGSDGVPLARITRDGQELVFDAPFPLTTPEVDGSQVTYPEVLEGVDLVVNVLPDGSGFSEVLRVASPEAAANPALAELTFPVETSEGLEVRADGGGFVAVDGADEVVFTSPTPVMWDSGADEAASSPQARRFAKNAGDSADAAEKRVLGPLEGDDVAPMPVELAAGSVTIEPDAEILTAEETVWPVYIDPAITAGRNEWTMLSSGQPDSAWGYLFKPDQGSGLCNPAVAAECVRYNVQRLVWEFNGLSAIGAMEASDIVSATFSVFGTHSYSCTATGVDLHQVSEITGASTWNNNVGLWGPQVSRHVVAHRDTLCGNARWIEFPATSAAQEVAKWDASAIALGLKATDEGSMQNGWKRYGWDANFTVEYNRAPSVTAMSMTNPTASCVRGAARPVIRTASPTLRVTVTDPDGQNVRANYGVYRQPGLALVAQNASALMASGGTAAYTVPAGVLVNGGIYEWHGQGSDSVGRWGTGKICEFEVDTAAPAVAPGVTAVAGFPAKYLEDRISGGLGQAGEFAFTNGGVTDVVSYKYSIDSDALDKSVTVASGARVPYTPTTVGSHRLLVQSVDRAGWTSPVRTYRFSVNFPTVNGLWHMDEGAGLTVANSAAGGKNPLTLSSGVGWVPGPFAEFESNPLDRAVRLDSTGDLIQTAAPVLNTSGDYTVMAYVKLDNLTGTQAAVSQTGQYVSAFNLGFRTDTTCPTSTGNCWSFWTTPTDANAPGALVRAMSDVTPRAGAWVHLTGVRQAGKSSVYVCELGTPENPGDGEPRQSTPVTSSATWVAGNGLQVGSGKWAGAPSAHLTGNVDDVRVYDVALPLDQIRQVCQGQDR